VSQSRLRRLAGLRTRMTVLLMAAVIGAGLGFELLLATVVWHTEYDDLQSRAHSLGRLLAERALTPLLVEDRLELQRQAGRAVTEPDVLAAAFYSARALALAQRTRDPGLWKSLGETPRVPDGRRVSLSRRRLPGDDVIEVMAPIVRGQGYAGSIGEASQLFGFTETPREARAPLGWVRLVISTRHAGDAVRAAARLGLLLLLGAAVLGFLAVYFYVRGIIRPLREARDLAREIASGHLDRRLPVRSADELGDLAGSMNTMAGALREARGKAETEAEAVRVAASAMLSIARGARGAKDLASVFQMVASELRRVTRARAVTLAVPIAHQTRPVFEHFDPPPPWPGLSPGETVPQAMLDLTRGLSDRAVRIPVFSGVGCPVCDGLAGDGIRAVLLVPLMLPDAAAPALLLAASDDADAFPPAEQDVVIALASHLSSALHAQRLESRLEDTFEELHRTHDYLVHSEMLRVAGEMASGVAHDFNNILGAILGRAQLLERRLESGQLSSEELMTSLAVIVRAAQDGRETGRRLRQFGCVSTTAAPQPVDLHAILRDSIEFTRPRWQNEAQASGRVIEVRFDSEPGRWVAGHASELREVFTNLLLNAIDALPRGGVIRIAFETDDERVRVLVADDGVGMDEETKHRLFEPFFTTKGERGTGLGLAVVYGIVQRHQGTIDVDTQPGAGTRMSLAFPRCEPPPRREQVPDVAGDLPCMDVLIVDDEQPVREVLRDILLLLGQQVVECRSAREALRAFRPGRFQLVLTDLGMPGMTGWDLAARLRAMDKVTPIVFVTGWGENVDRHTAGGMGADLVLGKPFDLEDVRGALRLAASRLEPRAAA
jgi:signal transduction histidine kinase/ActR/RegA family two-component response regulator